MTSPDNPWERMGLSTRRRVVAESPHDVFWITDSAGRYGFLIATKESVMNTKTSLSLKGITVVKREVGHGNNEFILVLNHREDWNIFNALCRDLIGVIVRHEDNRKMVDAVENQLKRWQRLLQHRPSAFTVEQQMGLFSELVCLREIVSKATGNMAEAISSWVGPDFDKQDFLISDVAIEVKSHRTSAGENVSISSANQLYCDKEPFYLISYGLTPTNSGLSVADESETVKTLCALEQLKELFENKLLQYGYAPEIITEPLQRFIVDKVRVFKITEGFPKIVPSNLKSQITSVKYTIDLSRCEEFELGYDEFVKEVAMP